MGVAALNIAEIVALMLGAAGTVLDVLAIKRRAGARLAWTSLTLRILGILALAAFVLAGRGRADFQDLVFVLYGILSAVALWLAAAASDVVLLVRHFRRGSLPTAG